MTVNGGSSVNVCLRRSASFRDGDYGKEGGLGGILEFTCIKNVNVVNNLS